MYGGTGLIYEKTEALYAEPNERLEAATSSYSATDEVLQYIYSIYILFYSIYYLLCRSEC